MKKIILGLGVALLAMGLCGPQMAEAAKTSESGAVKASTKAFDYPVTSVTIEGHDTDLEVGDIQQLKAIVEPSNASEPSVSWFSTNSNVVKTDQTGKITAVSPGYAIVYVRTVDGGLIDQTVIFVKAKAPQTIDVTGVKIGNYTSDMVIGSSQSLTATVMPTNATNKGIKWSSSDENILVVSQSGRVSALNEGTAVITVITDDGAHIDTATIKAKKPFVPVTSIRLEPHNTEMFVGEGQQLLATILPSNATNQGVKWLSLNDDIATVNADGIVIAKAVGTVRIYAAEETGNQFDYTTITVKKKVVTPPKPQPVFNMGLPTYISMRKCSSFTLYPILTSGTYRDIKWTTTNCLVAKVVNGNIVKSSLCCGTTYLVGTAPDGSQAYIQVKVSLFG